jgi:hypothetical protein
MQEQNSMINVGNEQVFPLPELPNHVPQRNGRRLSIATAYRWSLNGVRGVKLETVQIGGARYTSLEALQRFAAALTAARDGRPAERQSPAADKKRKADTAAALDRLGI